MGHCVSVSSIELPYQEAIDLIWTDNNALFKLGLGVDFVYQDMYDVLNLLLSSAKANNFEFVKFLVEKDADVSRVVSYRGGSTTTQDASTLKFAVMKDNVEIAKYLLDHGANANIMYRTQGCFHYKEQYLLDIANSQQMKDLLNVYMP